MRKFISILLFTLYSVATLGATVQLHFCGDELVTWQMSTTINLQDEDCCSKVQDGCGMQDDHNCCKDIQVKVNADQNQLLSIFKISLSDFDYVPVANITPHFETANYQYTKIYHNHFAQPPPFSLWQNIPLYILFENKKFGNC